MPIKFRCRYCEQFLGISKSRAGAVVDCPQCGRSVRVPDLNGRTRKLPDTPHADEDDVSLRTALSELSTLNLGTAPEANPVERPPATQHQEAYEPVVVSSDDHSDEDADPVPLEPEWSTVPDPEYSEAPIALEDSLSEIAALRQESEISPSDQFMAELNNARTTESWLSLTGLFVLALTLTTGFGAGWWLTASGILPRSSQSLETDDAAVQRLHEGQGIDENREPPPESSADAEMVVQGRIEYQGSDGSYVGDGGATILLLPAQRSGTLLLDARSLQQDRNHADRKATTAALNSLGAAIVNSDKDGYYAVSRRSDAECSVIVISRHIERSSDVNVQREIDVLLQTYFDSPNHIYGQLAVDAAIPRQSEPLDFRFPNVL